MSERGRGKCTVVLGVTAVETALISATRVDGQTALHVLNARRPSALVYTTAISRRRSLQYVCDERGLWLQNLTLSELPDLTLARHSWYSWYFVAWSPWSARPFDSSMS